MQTELLSNTQSNKHVHRAVAFYVKAFLKLYMTGQFTGTMVMK